MGMKLFRSASIHDRYKPTLPEEPRPDNFNIISTREVNGNLVAVVNYPNSTNFEGNKILVFKGISAKELKAVKLLDPHFSRNCKFSPFARLVPTNQGFNAAVELCKII